MGSEDNFIMENDHKSGKLELIIGNMFSGKSTELIRRINKTKIICDKIIVINHSSDTRNENDVISTHDNKTLNCVKLSHLSDFDTIFINRFDYFFIDEAQFFDAGIIEVCETLMMQGKRVIVAGLDMDYLGKPFGPMPSLLATADFITKLHAICVKCGHLANISYRTSDEEGTVVLGEKNNYEPRCRICATK